MSGVEGVVFHIYDAGSMTVPGATLITPAGASLDLHQIYQGVETPWNWDVVTQKSLADRAHDKGMAVIVMAECKRGLAMASAIGADALKMHANALNDWDLLKSAAALGKPLFLLTAMATKQDIQDALAVIPDTTPVILMYGAPGLPSIESHTYLDTIADMRSAFGRAVGFADHTPGFDASLGAIGAEAQVVEKLATIDAMPNGMALSFADIEALVQQTAAGMTIHYGEPGVQYPGDNAAVANTFAPRILAAQSDIRDGEPLTLGFNLRTIRGPRDINGMPTVSAKHDLGGQTAQRDMPANTILVQQDLRP